MNALVIETCTPDTYVFIEGLHDLTHCCVRHCETLGDGLSAMERTYFDIVFTTMCGQSTRAPRIVRQIQSHAINLFVRLPEVFVLFNGSLPISDAISCRELGAMSLRRDIPEAVYEEARLGFWKRATRKQELTVRVDYRNGYHFLFVGSPSTRVELGAQLTRLAVLLLSGNETYPVEYIADELEICRQSVKKYIFQLRRTFIEACGHPTFWMEKRPGGTVCGAKADVVWS